MMNAEKGTINISLAKSGVAMSKMQRSLPKQQVTKAFRKRR